MSEGFKPGELQIIVAKRREGKSIMTTPLTEGQRRLLQNLASRGMPEFGQVCRQVGCSLDEAEQLAERGLVIVDGDDDEEDPRTVIFITEAGKEAVR